MTDPARPRLTVLIITYNHETYIRRAVESVLMQNLPEGYEVIVADDCSTDHTRQIMGETFGNTSVRYLDNTGNLGITENYRRSFLACRTEYVAVLEGDDYWINPNKLNIQMAFLDEHHECDAVSANYFIFDEKTFSFTARSAINSDFSYISARDLIADNLIGNFSTCMYRVAALKAIPDILYEGIAYDWGINICVARNALIGFVHTPLSVYRIHGKGTWSALNKGQRDTTQLNVIDHYDRSTDFVFNAEFNRLTRQLKLSIREPGSKKHWPHRIGAILLACVPPGIGWILEWLRRMFNRFLLPPIIPIATKKLRKRFLR